MLTISPAANAALAAQKQERFIAQTKAAIRQNLGPETAHLDDAALDQRVRQALEESQGQGLKSPTAVSRYAAMSCVYGKNPEHAHGAAAAFTDKNLSDEARVNAVQDAAPDQRIKAFGGPGQVDWDEVQTRFRLIWPMDKPDIDQPVQSCPFAPRSGCCMRRLRVRCQHHEREYILELPGPKDKIATISLVTEESGCDEVEFAMDGGPCIKGRDEPYLVVTGANLKARDKTYLKVPLGVPERKEWVHYPAGRMWDLLLGNEKAATSYQLSASGCEVPANFGARVLVYPKYEISVALSGKMVDHSFDWSESEEEFDSAFELGFTVKYLGRKVERSLDFFEAIKKMAKILRKLRADSEKADRAVETLWDKERSFNVKLLHGSLTGAMTLAERHGSPDVYRKGSIAIALDPLFEMSWKKDIFPGLVMRIGYFGGVLGAVVARCVVIAWERWRANPVAPVKARVDFVVTGKISSNMAFETDFDGKWTKAGADRKSSSDVSLKFSLEGEVKAKTKHLKILFGDVGADEAKDGGDSTAGLHGSAEFIYALKDEIVDGKPGTSGQLKCTGLTLKAFYAVDIATTTVAPLPSMKGGSEQSWQLVEEFTIPPKPEPRPLSAMFGD